MEGDSMNLKSKKRIKSELKTLIMMIYVLASAYTMFHLYSSLTGAINASHELSNKMENLTKEKARHINVLEGRILELEDENEEIKDKFNNLQEKIDNKNKLLDNKDTEVDRLKEELKKQASGQSTSLPSRGGGNGDYKTFTATAYTKNCYQCSGITAGGTNLHELDHTPKLIAADPNILPLGTKVEIKGMGTYTVDDTGGKIIKNRVDILFPTKAEARQFGVQDVQIKIIK
jgi:3D (Asp-Asp-Asp) domain-containing protein